MNAQKKRSHVLHYKNPSLYMLLFQNFEFFPVPALPNLSNMPTSFCDKVPALKYKTECEGSSTFGEVFKHLTECHVNRTFSY